MQRGGFDIIPLKESDFKYTKDTNRILWTKNVFPIGEYIAQAILSIPWSTYKFKGTTTLWIEEDDNNNTPSFRYQTVQKLKKINELH